MNKNFFKVAFVAAVAMVAGINVFNAQKTELMSDIAMENVEALAQGESSDEFTEKTCCKAVWEDVKCKGCDGYTHTYAVKVD